ncbi:FkbM family methyltransferase [Bradyrhizobium japonicum]|uniref:FkbM family methyltransferase n=1 Tax=Bradyrhizobium TaxID=374 RepID=UPI001FD9858C|nr:FkbM family methyltransferase [Bradyrhizobium japonicum]
MLEDVHFFVRCLRYRLRTESLQLKALLRLRLTGATVLDIGANKGIYSYWLAKAVGPRGRVLAIEPQPEMAEYIRQRGLGPNVEIVNLALSDAGGVSQLSRKRPGDGSASLSRNIGGSIPVKLAKLDDIGPISNLKFIKCDVEGHELKVFRGGEHLIRKFSPVIQFESTPGEITPLLEFFSSLGYSGIMFLGKTYAQIKDISTIPHPKFGLSGHRDFIFFPKEAIGSIIPQDHDMMRWHKDR